MLFPVRIETEIEKPVPFTYLIVGANMVVFFSIHFFSVALREMAYYDYGFIADQVNLFSLISHTFIHVGWLHIGFNMYYFWLYGRAIEQRIGRPVFVLLYFSSAVAGAFAQAALTPEYLTDVPAIGASGAVSGVLGAYMMLYPRDKVTCFYFASVRYMTTITISSIWVLGSWLVFQFVDALWFSVGAEENFVAYWAHIGGFIFGAGSAAIIKYSAELAGMLRRRSITFALEECSDLIHKGRAEEARAKLKAALEKQPDDPLILGELGRLELTDDNRSAARKLFRRSLKRALKQKSAAAAAAAYFGLVAAKAEPPDNSRRLIVGRRFARLKKYGHALGVMGGAFGPDAEIEGLDRLLYEIAELYAGPLNDTSRATAAFSLLMRLFPHSPRSLDAKYRLRRLRAVGRA